MTNYVSEERVQVTHLKDDSEERLLREALKAKDLTMDDVCHIEPSEDVPEEEPDAFQAFREELASALIDRALDTTEHDDVSNLGQFDALRRSMIPLTEDSGVCKKVMKEGEGLQVPKGAVVIIHYSAYLEDIDEPYDSTALQNRPKKFRSDQGEVVAGLDIAVLSMRKGEKALFLCDPAYNLGEGVPPRVPRNARVLFEVELLKWIDSNSAEAYEILSKSERQKAPFSILNEAVNSQRNLGNAAFHAKKFTQAVACYRKAIDWLENYRYNNEEEELQGNQLRLYLHLNTAQGYLVMGEPRPQQAIVQCKSALSLDPKNVKALYRKGEAFRILGECDKAKACYLQAQRLEPHNPKINEAIKLANDKVKQQEKVYKTLCQNMFSPKTGESRTTK